MGALYIDGAGEICLDEELLDHVFTVVVVKLRRKEPVLLTWHDDAGQEQRILISHVTSIRAEFDTAARAPRDKRWLDRLMIAASSNGGLSISSAITDRDGGRIPTEHLPAPDLNRLPPANPDASAGASA